MGIMDRLRGGSKNGNGGEPEAEPAANGQPEGVPLGVNAAEPVLTVTDAAKEKIRAVLGTQSPPVTTIRIGSPYRGKYTMNLEPEGKPDRDDTVLPYDGFEVYVDSQSLPLVTGATVDYVETYGGGGFQFTNPNDEPKKVVAREAPEGPEGEIWRQIQQILDDEVNPAVAMHGGHIGLIEYKDGTVFVEMGGGCQGCGMANVTLKQGVERILRDHIPEIEQILDVTDHAGGANPYYAPSTK